MQETRLSSLRLQKRLLDADLTRRLAGTAAAHLLSCLFIPVWQAGLCFALFLGADTLMRQGLARLIADPASRVWLLAHLVGGFLAMSFYLMPAALVWVMPGIAPKLGGLIAVFGAMLSVLLVRTVYLPQAVANSLPLAGMAGFIIWQEYAATTTFEIVYLMLCLSVLGWYFILALIKFNQHQRELAQARDTALARAETQKRFLATMSHELRTPLNGILGMAQDIAARHPGLGAEVICDSARDMSVMVGDLLDKAAIDAGALRINLRPVSPATEFARLREAWQDRFATKGLHLTLELAPGLPAQMMADGLRLSQCLSNLLSNALRWTGAGGTVALAAGSHPTGVQITVTDNGPGLPAGAEQALFQPYASFGATDGQPGQGTGLGLSISRGLARAMGGDLVFERPVDGGARFRLVLPAIAVKTGDHPPPPPEDPARGTAALRPGVRVMVVDDIGTNRLVLRLVLQRHGFVVAEAASGDEAVELLSAPPAQPPDAILMDLRMPGLSGEDTLQRLRRAGIGCPVLAVSADAAPETHLAVMARGFDGYLTKPVEEHRLLESLDQVLTRGAARQATGL